MSLIHWLFRLINRLRPTSPAHRVPKARPRRRSALRRLKALPWVVTASLCVSPMIHEGSAEVLPAQGAGKGTIVAAGFGYQIGELSEITVKVYDAASGDVISDDTFDLHVKEDTGAKGAASQERIFAGGVGLGATDLSNFVLRVYDAKTGAFQWEGQLNLTPGIDGGSGQMVSTLVPRRAHVTKIRTTTATGRQPSFLLRALDSSTGGLVWQDEFSTGDMRVAGIERIANLINQAEAAQTFDFRIRMLEGSGRDVLWEDHFAREQVEENSHPAADDQAHVLPAWPRLFEEDPLPQAL